MLYINVVYINIYLYFIISIINDYIRLHYMNLQPNYFPPGHFAHFLVFFFIIAWMDVFGHKASQFLTSPWEKIAGDGMTRPKSVYCLWQRDEYVRLLGERSSPLPPIRASAAHLSLVTSKFTFVLTVCFALSFLRSCLATSGCPWPAWSSSCSCATCSTKCSVASAGTRTTCAWWATWRPGEWAHAREAQLASA